MYHPCTPASDDSAYVADGGRCQRPSSHRPPKKPILQDANLKGFVGGLSFCPVYSPGNREREFAQSDLNILLICIESKYQINITIIVILR